MLIEPRWYVLEGLDGEEGVRRAVTWLAMSRMQVWRPFQTKRAPARRAGRSLDGKKRKDRAYPRFGRYFFIRCELTDSLFHEIRHAPNVRGFVCTKGTERPFPVPDEQIDWLRNPENLPERPPGWETVIHKGMRVTVAHEYPLWGGMTGLVTSIDKRGIVHVDLSNRYGSPVPIILEIGHVVEAAEQAKSPNASGITSTRPNARLVAGA